jgi:acyl carrier protein
MIEVTDLVIGCIADLVDIDRTAVRLDALLVDDLGMDGDDYGMELVPRLAQLFDIHPPREQWENVHTVTDLINVVLEAKGAAQDTLLT